MRWIMIAILLAVVSAGISNSAYTQRRPFKRTVRNESITAANAQYKSNQAPRSAVNDK